MVTENNQPGQGKGIAFLRALLDSAPPTCVTWPMSRDPSNGYGRLGVNGKNYWAHRLMCELAKGPAPSAGHEATHSCGNGKLGCVNPRHLDWGTRSRNQLDRRFHGTKARGGRGVRRKLTPEKVAEIRALKGLKTQREIAAKFGVSDATIRDIYSGKSWKRPDQVFTVAEVYEIRKLGEYITHERIAAMFKVHSSKISRICAGKTYKEEDLKKLVA